MLPVLSLNTNEEKLVMRAFGEEHSVGQQCTAIRGLVKTSAFAKFKRKTSVSVFPLHPGSVQFDIVADFSQSHTAERFLVFF